MSSAEDFRRCIRVRVEKFVQTARPSKCEILSLNCGEGAECIGICQELRRAGVQRVSLVTHNDSPGTDLHVQRRVKEFVKLRLSVDETQKTGNWMELIREFAKIGRRFHLMVLNIATFDDNDQLKFMVSTVPQVLVNDGRVFVPNYHESSWQLNYLTNWGYFVVCADCNEPRDQRYQCLEFINVICDAENAGEAESRQQQTSSDSGSSSSSGEDNDEWEEDNQSGKYFAKFADQIRLAGSNSEKTGRLGTWEEEADEYLVQPHYAAGENSCVKAGDTVRSVYSNWLNAVNKDQTKFYKKTQFRQDYTKFQMPNRAATFCDTVQSQVNEFVNQNPKQRFRILSLGCGPGSDVIGVCNSIHRCDGSKTIHCTGVDCYDWQWETPDSEKRRNSLQMMPDKVKHRFLQQKLQEFTKHYAGEKFDLVIVNYAEGQQILRFVLKNVPPLLSCNDSCLVVVGNNRNALQTLTQVTGVKCMSTEFLFCFSLSQIDLDAAAKDGMQDEEPEEDKIVVWYSELEARWKPKHLRIVMRLLVKKIAGDDE